MPKPFSITLGYSALRTGMLVTVHGVSLLILSFLALSVPIYCLLLLTLMVSLLLSLRRSVNVEVGWGGAWLLNDGVVNGAVDVKAWRRLAGVVLIEFVTPAGDVRQLTLFPDAAPTAELKQLYRALHCL